MPLWYFQQDNETYGPLKASELIRLVRDGTIQAQTPLRKDESAWFPADQVGGLFAAAAQPSVEYTCTDCGSTVGKPPTYCRKCRRMLDYARPKVTANEIEGYQASDTDKSKLSDSWKQWVRRFKAQRETRTETRPPD